MKLCLFFSSHSKILKVSDPRTENSFLQRSNPHPHPVDYVLSLPGTLSRFTSKSGKLCVFDKCTCICQVLTVVAGKSEVL